ncbi:MAG: hypothetical protein FWH55_10980 [Oscillospiraceae bacterium]|nr:hypothetical protein [Oscillospiraceae bacterium]
MMSFVSIFRKIRLKRAARRDANGRYGEFLLYRRRKAQEEPPFAIPLQPSAYMELLVKEYRSKCKEIEQRRICTRMLYARILRQYETLGSSLDDAVIHKSLVENQANEIDRKITSLQSALILIKDHWAEANQTGVVTPQMGVANLGELKQKITVTENAISGLEREKSDLAISSNSRKNESDRRIKESRSPFDKLVAKYKSKIDSLYGVIKGEGSKYEKELCHYWRFLWRRLEKREMVENDGNVIFEPSKSFSEICQLCGTQLVQKTELFTDERHIINTQIKDLVKFKITV